MIFVILGQIDSFRKYTFLLLSLLFPGCKKENRSNTLSLPEQTTLNIAYRTDPAQKMDIHLPADKTILSAKVIILIHHGGWNQGDKADSKPYVDTLKHRLPDHGIFNINYPLGDGSTNFFPTRENDVKGSLEFIYGKTTEYNISQQLVLPGSSAGGHLCLLHGYRYTCPVKIKDVIDFFGPVDFVEMYNNPANPFVLLLLLGVPGGDPTTLPTLYQQSGPINFATAQCPPALIIQGGHDILISTSQAVSRDIKLQTLGVIHQYGFYLTEGNAWVGANIIDSFDKIAAFLTANPD